MKHYTSEAREAYEDRYAGLFSKKLAEFAINNMRTKDSATGAMKAIKSRSIDEVLSAIKDAGIKIAPKYEYTAWYLFNMTIADYPKSLTTDEQRALFVYETLFDPDSKPEAVLECYTAKQCIENEPIYWEKYL